MYTDVDEFDAIIDTPVGPVGVAMRRGRVHKVGFPVEDARPRVPQDAELQAILQRLKAYFSGREDLCDLPVETSGTPFQQKVWSELRRIPAGEVRTYGELAKQLNTAPRAIGGACRANPCPLLIPCHRVVAANGKGGFGGATSGRWVEIKTMLLSHEGVLGSA